MRICQYFGLAPFEFDRKSQKWQQNSNLIYFSVAVILSNAALFVGTTIFNDSFVDQEKKEFWFYLLLLN